MRNPEITKEKILKEAGVLFNTRGYKATSISEITEATGFTKGAIYRHFENKEVLEKEVLFYLSSIMFEKLRAEIISRKTAPDKLRAVFQYFRSYTTHPPIEGGCPLMNAAIESDDAYDLLRKEASRIMQILRESVLTILGNGIRYGQIRPDIDKDRFTTLVISALEGAIMMSKLKGDDTDIRRVAGFLEEQLKTLEP